MAGGRPAKLDRTDFGERIYSIRQQLGLSQNEVARKLGVSQQAYAGWERSTVALKPGDIAKLADVLKVSADELLGRKVPTRRGTGPVGKARSVFEKVSTLPRNQQQHIVRVVEDLLVARGVNGNGN